MSPSHVSPSTSSRLLHVHVALSHPAGVSSTDVNPNSPLADPRTGSVGSGRPLTSHVAVYITYLDRKPGYEIESRSVIVSRTELSSTLIANLDASMALPSSSFTARAHATRQSSFPRSFSDSGVRLDRERPDSHSCVASMSTMPGRLSSSVTSRRRTRTSRLGADVCGSSTSVVSPRSISTARSTRDLAPSSPNASESTPLAVSHRLSDAMSSAVPVQRVSPGSSGGDGGSPATACADIVRARALDRSSRSKRVETRVDADECECADLVGWCWR
mmetsp:Transcript_11107/g.48037  ORF Transcript_11107/g.48037 Transcript_11107/m.48037 type:complete len:274 (-) Transcript_11107:130-951(-)